MASRIQDLVACVALAGGTLYLMSLPRTPDPELVGRLMLIVQGLWRSLPGGLGPGS